MNSTYIDTCKRMIVVERAFQEALRAQQVGVSILGAHILRLLGQEDGQRASDLARQTARAVTSFTPLLDALEKVGYVERASGMDDRRTVRLYLTPAGRKLIPGIKAAFIEAEQAVAPKPDLTVRPFVRQPLSQG